MVDGAVDPCPGILFQLLALSCQPRCLYLKHGDACLGRGTGRARIAQCRSAQTPAGVAVQTQILALRSLRRAGPLSVLHRQPLLPSILLRLAPGLLKAPEFCQPRKGEDLRKCTERHVESSNSERAPWVSLCEQPTAQIE